MSWEAVDAGWGRRAPAWASEQLIVPGAGVRADLNWGYLVGRR